MAKKSNTKSIFTPDFIKGLVIGIIVALALWLGYYKLYSPMITPPVNDVDYACGYQPSSGQLYGSCFEDCLNYSSNCGEGYCDQLCDGNVN